MLTHALHLEGFKNQCDGSDLARHWVHKGFAVDELLCDRLQKAQQPRLVGGQQWVLLSVSALY